MAEKKTSDRPTSKRNLILGAIAVIVIVIIILYSISTYGYYSTPPPIGTACVPQSGFLCKYSILNNITGDLTLTLGQNTGKNWNNVYLIFVPYNTQVNSSGVPQVSFVMPNTTYLASMISSRAIATINLIVAKPNSLTMGQGVTGTIWAKYMVNGSTNYSYSEIAALNIKAS